MTKHKVNARWLGNRAFEGVVTGHKVVIDTPADSGGDNKGPSPKQLMLLSLAGCTGIDVALILGKMKIELEDFNVIVEGELTEENPKYYRHMHVIYEFTGNDLPYDKLKRAIDLSEQKYCGVSALYKKAIDVTSEIRILTTAHGK
ncbi:MAG TPA: OsmC family protein [Bacteroidales bacterium]|nr:OsmC family protein [Bacteroidales bacterium]